MYRKSGSIVFIAILALLCLSAVMALAGEAAASGYGRPQVAPAARAIESLAIDDYATVITVTSSLDPDTSLSKTCYAGTSPEAPCTLRRAFVEANLTSIARPVLIKFSIPLADPGYVEELGIWRIELAAALPVLRESQITIDGQTQNEIGGRTTAPPIYVQGSDIVDTSTMLLVRYLALADGKFNVWDSSTVEYNWTGLAEDGESVYYVDGNPQLANGAGINISGENNTVRNNVTASSDGTSLDVNGSDNLVVGNFVGTNARGTLPDVPFHRRCHTDARFDNWFTGNGIVVHNTANRNQIGGPTPAERNVIAGMLFANDSPTSTPPVAVNILGDQTLVQNNYIGLDVDGHELWTCGTAVVIDGEFNQFLDNAIVNAGVSGFSINGNYISLDAITLQGNVIINTPGALVFGPGVPSAWQNFNPAQITSLEGTAVGGTSGADSPCAHCVVELFLDDGDDQVEALESLVTTTADASGHWAAVLPRALADGEGLRTASTTADWDQIPSFEAGTTTRFSDLYPGGVTPPPPTPDPTLPPPEVVPTPVPVTPPQLPATYTSIITVTSAGDPDTSLTKSCYTNFGSIQPASPCTLRRAIVEANALSTAARPVLIKFNIPLIDSYDATLDMWTITLMAELPNVAGEWVIIDGETQGEIGGRAGAPKLLLQGSDLTLNGDHDAVRHLALLDGRIEARGDYVLLEHNWAGLVADGQSVYYVDDDPTLSNGAGIDALGNYGALRNNSAASADGVSIKVDGSYNLVVGNTAGTRADGTLPDVGTSRRCHPDAGLSNPSLNWFTGVGMSISGDNNWIGGATVAERNVIAGMLFASESPNVTPPDALYLASTADYNVLQNNHVGVDTNGQDAWVCGQALVLNGKFNWTVGNTLANSQITAAGIYGTYVTLDALTLRGNIIRDVPAALEFGPGVPADWSLFQPAQVTAIDGTTASGTSGSGSPCPYCIVEVFLDDDDEYVEALASWGTTTADENGNWSLTLPRELADGEGLRTTSTTQHYGIIANFEVGTTSGFSELYRGGWTVYLPLVMRGY
ncbi:MAG: hypothetical protein JXA93_02740 [Anaerolineae bacterium]|nr:hypothetical protein [Anaerolineae bacterium]